MLDKFSSNLAFSLADFDAYKKGEKYFNGGAVSKIWKENAVYYASVKGARRYLVSIKIEDDELKIDCTCPYEFSGICKHAVAAILAFSKHPELSIIESFSEEKLKISAKKLLSKASDKQIKKILENLLIMDQKLQHDFIIFLQGPKETNATVLSYKEKITRELDELDLDDLLEAWYNSGDGYYDYYENRSNYSEDTVSELIKPFSEEAQKYAVNENYVESIKIYQAIIEALNKKSKSLAGDNSDLSDWFDSETDTVLTSYIETLTHVFDEKIKKIGAEYLCILFLNKSFIFTQAKIGEGIKQIVSDEIMSGFVLGLLKSLIDRKDLSEPESSLLAHLYLKNKKYFEFEKISLANLEKNPKLVLGLMEYYFKQKRKPDVIGTAFRVLKIFNEKRLTEKYGYGFYDRENIEIDIRKFLKKVFSYEDEYKEVIENLEAIFLLTGNLNDYKELASTYHSNQEKERFIELMKKHFTKSREIKPMFEVFGFENKKKEILELTTKYKDEKIFPEMIVSISRDYPEECFSNYQAKIKNLLKEADTRIYPEAANHLEQMKQINLQNKFRTFVEWIRTTYYRRRRLIEELDKHKF